MKLEFCKELYEFEIERKDKLDSVAAILPAAISGLVVAIVFVVKELAEAKSHPLSEIGFVLFGISAFMLAIAVVCLVSGFHGSVYRHMDYADKLKAYHDELASFHDGDTNKADAEFNDYLKAKYIEFAAHNGRANDAKADRYYQARRWFSWALLPFGCGCVVYAYHVVSGLSAAT